MYTILIFYKIRSLKNPLEEAYAHKEVCRALGLTGRILIGKDGINGTVAGEAEAIAKYRAYMDSHPQFKKIDFKESFSENPPFPNLQVKHRKEIITTGDRARFDWQQKARYVSPETLHGWLKDGEKIALVDMRNDYEWEVGRFVGALKPPMRNFRELTDFLVELVNKYKGQKVVTYCTAGIRCEPATALLVEAGFPKKDLYQLHGGIVRYVEKFGNEGFFVGRNFVFDARLTVPVADPEFATVVGECFSCRAKTENFLNCADAACHRLLLVCEACAKTPPLCSDKCRVSEGAQGLKIDYAPM